MKHAVRKDREVKKVGIDGFVTLSDGTLYEHKTFDLIAQGDNSYNRDGREILAIGTQMKGVLTNGSTLHNSVVRIACVIMKEESTSMTTDFFACSTSASPISFGTGDDKLRLIRPLNKDKLTVLWEHSYVLGANNTESSNVSYMRIVKSPLIKINRKITYDTTGTGSYQQCRPLIRWVYWVEHGATTINTVSFERIILDYFTDS